MNPKSKTLVLVRRKRIDFIAKIEEPTRREDYVIGLT